MESQDISVPTVQSIKPIGNVNENNYSMAFDDGDADADYEERPENEDNLHRDNSVDQGLEYRDRVHSLTKIPVVKS